MFHSERGHVLSSVPDHSQLTSNEKQPKRLETSEVISTLVSGEKLQVNATYERTHEGLNKKYRAYARVDGLHDLMEDEKALL